MPKPFCALLVVLLGCASDGASPAPYDETRRAFPSVEAAVLHLSQHAMLESKLVGIGGTESRGFIAFHSILDSPRPRQHLLSLARRGSVVGKIYGLIGLNHVDPAAYQELEAVVLREHGQEPILVMLGCVGQTRTVAEVVRGSNSWPMPVRDGSWWREYSRSGAPPRNGV